MMFKGTKRFRKGEIDRITAQGGGFNNAFTTYDFTAYFFQFASDRWWPALDIEADRLRNLILDPVEFELERLVIIEELKMEVDSPWCRLRRMVEEAAFPGSPYGRPIIGYAQDVEGIQVDQMISYYDRHYRPENALLVIAGSFDRLELEKRLDDCFPSAESGDLQPCVYRPLPGMEATGPIRVEGDRQTQVPRMLAAFYAPSLRSRDFAPFLVLDKLLAEGKLCRLYQGLIENDDQTTALDAELDETFDSYLYLIRLELSLEADLDRVEERLFDELANLNSIDEDELERSRNQLLTELVSDLETGLDRAVRCGHYRLFGKLPLLFEMPNRIRRVTVDQIRDVAFRYLQPVNAIVGKLRP
jgi:zinc protease